MAAPDATRAPFAAEFPPYRLVATRDLPALVRLLIAQAVPIGLDVEATGIDPWANKLISLQLGDERGVFVADVRHLNDEDRASLAATVRLLIAGGTEVVGHNVKFDFLMLAVQLDIGPDELRLLRLHDTMLAEQVILGGVDALDGGGRERANLRATAAVMTSS
jgi:3'-5' exonuclease